MTEPQFLNVLAIKKIAFRKGCTAERTATIKQRHYVQLFDAKGRAIDGPRPGMAMSLAQAKRTLEAMPDRVLSRQGNCRAKSSKASAASLRGDTPASIP